MKKIKIIEGMDLMRDDIRSAFENNYIGINNSYDNKVMFVAAINQYFDGLVREGVLYGDAENTADIDVNAQREWLAQNMIYLSTVMNRFVRQRRAVMSL